MRDDIHGRVADGYEGVRAAFVKNFDLHGEVGAGFCAFVDGVCVVDLWGGVADPESQRPWAADTMAVGFSMTKGLSALLANRLVAAGILDPAAPVADYWPEFAAGGKERVTVEQLLSHRAGLAVIEGEFTLDEALSWEPVVAQLAAQVPQWEPGTAHGYHLRSFGWLVGELLRRVDPRHRTMGVQLHDDVCTPLGLADDLFVGLPSRFEPRVAMLVPPPADAFDLVPRDWPLWRAMTGPSDRFRYDSMWNEPALHGAELPSSNGIGTARAFASVYASLLGAGLATDTGPVRLLDDAAVERATRPLASGPDRVILTDTAFGLGFMLPPSAPAAFGSTAFGHGGAGGSGAYADRERGIAACYIMNRLRFDLEDTRRERLFAAVTRCADALRA